MDIRWAGLDGSEYETQQPVAQVMIDDHALLGLRLVECAAEFAVVDWHDFYKMNTESKVTRTFQW
jgi:hypothetical protein